MRGSITEHGLIMESYYDLQASCTCRGWLLTAPTFDHESQAEIYERAKEQHAMHRQIATKKGCESQ